MALRFNAKGTSNDGEFCDKEHGKSMEKCLLDHENGIIICSYYTNTIEATDNRGIRPIKRSCILSEILLTDWIFSRIENEFQNSTKWIQRIHLKPKNPDPIDGC